MTPSTKNYARAKKVCAIYDISRTTLWNWINTRPGFPQPVKVGPNTTLHDLAAIDAFLGLSAGSKEVHS